MFQFATSFQRSRTFSPLFRALFFHSFALSHIAFICVIVFHSSPCSRLQCKQLFCEKYFSSLFSDAAAGCYHFVYSSAQSLTILQKLSSLVCEQSHHCHQHFHLYTLTFCAASAFLLGETIPNRKYPTMQQANERKSYVSTHRQYAYTSICI